MHIPKSSEQDKEFVRSVIPGAPPVQVKAMFGNLGAFANCNMFAGLFGATIEVRLDEPRRSELSAVDGVGPFGPTRRPVGGSLALPDAWRSQPEQVQMWVQHALVFVSALPPKTPRPRKPRE